MKLVATLLFALSIIFCSEAQSQQTGIELLKDCREYEKLERREANDDVGFYSCLMLIKGVSDMVQLYSEIEGISKAYKMCMDEGVTLGQTTKVVIKYLEENPEKLHFEDSSLVFLALVSKFPCD